MSKVKQVGMGAIHYQANPILKCDERVIDSCGSADRCCAVVSCRYCLELEYYGDEIFYGFAELSGEDWVGTVNGLEFVARWERDPYTNACEFNVWLGGEKVSGENCSDVMSCRDSSGEAILEIDYEEVTLRWDRHLLRELPHRKDPDTGCIKWFCGDCECTAECLCVTVTDPQGGLTKGQICISLYDEGCGPPVWEGNIGGYDLELQLGYDIYDNCILLVRIDGIDQDPVPVIGCSDISASIQLYDGTTIDVAGKFCDCEESNYCPCCPGWPQGASATLRWFSISAEAPPGSSPQEVSGDFGCSDEIDEGTIIYIAEEPLNARVFCVGESNTWKVQYKSPATSPSGGIDAPELWAWVDVEYDFQCPDCADAVDGIATGTIDFVGKMRYDSSGGIVDYDVIIHADIQLVC